MKHLIAFAALLAVVAYQANAYHDDHHGHESVAKITPQKAKLYADLFNIYMTNLEAQQKKSGRSLPPMTAEKAQLFTDLMNIYMEHLEKKQIKQGILKPKGRGVSSTLTPGIKEGKTVGNIMMAFAQ